LQELRESIDAWRASHAASKYVSFVRVNDFPETKQMEGDNRRRRPNSVFGLLFLDPLSNLDPAVREFELSRQLAERFFYYLQRMPLVISWQTDELYGQMLSAPEVKATLAETTRFVDNTSKFAEATTRFAQSIEQFREELPGHRQDATRELEAATARQREAAIDQATTRVAVERDAAVRQLTRSLGVEQERIVEKLRGAIDGSIDHLYGKLSRLALTLIAAVFAAAVAYRLLFRTRRGASSAAPPAAPPADDASASAIRMTSERATAR
jgi:hypothetical protein